jgi:predicted NUDIX family phosphoesterase
MSELVACIPAELVKALDFQGLNVDRDQFLPLLSYAKHVRYLPRDFAETSEDWKQLIPYNVLVRKLDAHVLPFTVFSYLRGGGQGEKRLHGRRSIGVGGHVSDIDGDEDVLARFNAGLQRELHEELILTTENGVPPLSFEPAALINDDSNAVGRVHLGVLYVHDVTGATVFTREVDILDPQWASFSVLNGTIDEYESWSQLVIPALCTLVSEQV